MSKFGKFWTTLIIICISFAGVALVVTSRSSCQPVDTKDPQRLDAKPDAPKEGIVYVWSLPNNGHQSLLVLNVVDGNTLDAAYLVPVRIKLKGVVAPSLNDKGGKEARAAVDKLLGGQLRTAQLFGLDKEGVLADFWIVGEKDGEKGQWASSIFVKQGIAKETK